ncbi:hypothetical protein [Phaeobacter inhibens]|uniref:hypothetical protein n=1 Tax=Phaeobacter inhibens TaxID=221822 RepID=UPI00295E4AE7|nr:hypothetical protein [Phaeobacter inhibens]
MANVGLTLAFFVFIGWWIFIGHMDKLRREEDPLYAIELFDGLLPVEKVLETRKWHAKGAEPWDCTYAIVRLKDVLPAEPPTRSWRNERGWQYRFGGDWQRTPAAPLGPNTRNAIQFCSKYWKDELVAEMQAVLHSDDAWYSQGRVGETLFIYAPQGRLAARIRFGD